MWIQKRSATNNHFTDCAVKMTDEINVIWQNDEMQQVIFIKTVKKMNVHYISVVVFNMLTGTLVVVHIQYLKSISVVQKKKTQTLSYFFLLGSCQRSTSSSMQWNQVLLFMSHWCITKHRRSCLRKHTLSKPREKRVTLTPPTVYAVSSGEKGREKAEGNFVAAMTLSLQMKRVKQSRLAGVVCQHHYLTLSEMINELKSNDHKLK